MLTHRAVAVCWHRAGERRVRWVAARASALARAWYILKLRRIRVGQRVSEFSARVAAHTLRCARTAREDLRGLVRASRSFRPIAGKVTFCHDNNARASHAGDFGVSFFMFHERCHAV